MQKDVIYIDVEDDITAIIGKVKAADHKIVALVPPKRAGAIQSAVNLKLVQRAAESVNKRLVLITNNAALVALASSASIPVARNLQSRPELAEIPALEIDEGDDIIDGSHIKDGTTSSNDDTDEAVEELVASENSKAKDESPKRTREALGAAGVGKSKSRVPNFDSFRKKLFLIIGGVVLLVGVLVWALVFAPTAKIIITARTTDSALSSKVSLGDTLTTSLKEGTVKTVTKTNKKTVSVPLTATGKKDVGEKSAGTVKLTKLTQVDYAVAAGTQIVDTDTGLVFVTSSATVIPASEPCFPAYCAQSVQVGVLAVVSGTKYNGATGAATMNGATASFVGATGGGTDKTVAVVQQSDIDAVANNIASSSDADTAKQTLTKAFGDDFVVLSDSFKQDTGGVKSTPIVGAEATDGKGVFAGDIVYSLVAIPKNELSKYLDAYFAQQIDGMPNQMVYSNGLSAVNFTNIDRGESVLTANVVTNGKYGPKINEQDIKASAKGKHYGEIQSSIQEIPGVDSVDIKFSPFWVTAAPSDENKIQVEFKVNGS